MSRRLRGQVAIVTGASDGIGRATALALARQGCRVAICARDAERLAAVAAELEAAGGRALALAGDVADRNFVERLVGATVDCFGTIDILVNNAGVGLLSSVQRLRREELDRALAVNLYGPLWAIQAVLPAMRAQRSGTIVNVASIVVDRPAPGIGGYAATKAALVALANTLRIEVLSAGIRVINVYPGLTTTRFGERSLRHPDHQAPDSARAGRPRPLRRFRPRCFEVPPERVAGAIVRAIRRGQREVYVTRRDRLLIGLSRLLPGLFDRLLALYR